MENRLLNLAENVIASTLTGVSDVEAINSFMANNGEFTTQEIKKLLEVYNLYSKYLTKFELISIVFNTLSKLIKEREVETCLN